MAKADLVKGQQKKLPRGKPFPKGTSGNPLGGPDKLHWWSELLKERAELESEVQLANGKVQRLKNKEIMADAIIEKAKAGDIAAIKEFGDRVAGKANQSVDMNVKGSISLTQAVQQADE